MRKKQKTSTVMDSLASLDWIDIIKIVVISATILSLMIVGFIMSLRPSVSETEKRELAKFPEVTIEGIWDGSFFKGVSLWYSDTYPLRDLMVSFKASFENFYGNKKEQIIYTDETPHEKEKSAVPSETNETVKSDAAKKVEENLPDGTVHNMGHMNQGIYIVNNRGYELYTFLPDLNTQFAASMNRIYDRISPKVNMYVMMVPTNSGVMLGDDVVDALGVSSQEKAIDFIYNHLNPGIKKVDAIRPLKKHNAEYIYFYTDHHWTALGAYYAYKAFCETKGIESHDIKVFESVSYPGFLGTLYAFSKKSPELAANPDTVTAYIPKGTNTMTIFENDGRSGVFNIINDLSSSHSAELYSTFVYGDHPFSYAHNEKIKDGSGVLLIKDSMGNAFVPWLVDHYEHIFWGDARYLHSTISDMLKNYKIQDVIFEVGIYNGAKPDIWKRYEEIGQ